MSKILRCLSKYWDVKVTIIFELKDMVVFSTNQLLRLLISQEQKLSWRNFDVGGRNKDKITTFKSNIYECNDRKNSSGKRTSPWWHDSSRASFRIRRRKLNGRGLNIKLVILLKLLIPFALSVTNQDISSRIIHYSKTRRRWLRRRIRIRGDCNVPFRPIQT